MSALKRLLKRSELSYRLALSGYFAAMRLWIAARDNVGYAVILGARFHKRLLSAALSSLGPDASLAVCNVLHRRADGYFAQGRVSKAISAWRLAAAIRASGRNVFCPPASSPPLTLLGRRWAIAIGHIALLGPIIKLAEGGKFPSRHIRLYVDAERVANDYLLGLLREHVEILPLPGHGGEGRRCVEFDDAGFELLETRDGPKFLYEACYLGEKLWLGRSPLLAFPQADAKHCQAQLANLGIFAGDWFVTVHIRGPAYRSDPDDGRNASIASYAEAIGEICKRGGKVLWLGERGTPLPHGVASHVVNYADSACRSPMLDIYVCAHSRFFLGTTSGIAHVPALFGVPTLFTNAWPPFARPWRGPDLWMPKTLALRESEEPVAPQVMFCLPQAAIQSVRQLGKRGFKLMENDATSLKESVQEMFERLAGKVIDEPAEERAQQQVDALLSTIGSYSSARIAKAFLRRHRICQ